MKDWFKKYLAEFIGTFFLVFTVDSVILYCKEDVIGAIAVGFILMVMVYASGRISGGHYNPAVSFACAIRGVLPYRQLLPYWIAQIAGALTASFTALPFMPAKVLPRIAYTPAELVIGEFLFTFVLCWVVLLTTTSDKTKGNSYYGLAIGATVTVGIFAIGGVLGYGTFNPAVSLSLYFIKTGYWVFLTYSVFASFAGSVVASKVFKLISE